MILENYFIEEIPNKIEMASNILHDPKRVLSILNLMDNDY
jgi:hypothetical protein